MFEIVAGWVAIYPYRCTGCDHRFLRFSYAEPGPAPGTGDREIQATRRSKAWKRKRREFLLYGVGIVCFLAFLYFITRDRGGSVDGG